jgi:hypothetical protein
LIAIRFPLAIDPLDFALGLTQVVHSYPKRKIIGTERSGFIASECLQQSDAVGAVTECREHCCKQTELRYAQIEEFLNLF